MKAFTILDPNKYHSGLHRWGFCYLHGDIEQVFERGEEPPDLFFCDEPRPKEGTYLCSINGLLAIAVIARHHGELGGRVSLISDHKALKHTLTPADWR